jgi:hypothetical protein
MDRAALHDSISESLGEELAAASGQRVPVVTATVLDVLTEADLAAYCEKAGNLPTTQKSHEKDIGSIRARHHQVARLLALGLPESVVANLTGYQAATLSTLKQSPSMLELIEHYRAPGDNAVKVMGEKLRLLADMSLEALIAKAELGELTAQELLAAAKLGADRSGNGPMSKVDVDVTHALDEGLVSALAATARKRNESRIIDVSAVRKALPKASSE